MVVHKTIFFTIVVCNTVIYTLARKAIVDVGLLTIHQNIRSSIYDRWFLTSIMYRFCGTDCTIHKPCLFFLITFSKWKKKSSAFLSTSRPSFSLFHRDVLRINRRWYDRAECVMTLALRWSVLDKRFPLPYGFVIIGHKS